MRIIDDNITVHTADGAINERAALATSITLINLICVFMAIFLITDSVIYMLFRHSKNAVRYTSAKQYHAYPFAMNRRLTSYLGDIPMPQ